MVRQANILLIMLWIGPAAYIVIATLVVFGRPGLARNPRNYSPSPFGTDRRLRCEHWRPLLPKPTKDSLRRWSRATLLEGHTSFSQQAQYYLRCWQFTAWS